MPREDANKMIPRPFNRYSNGAVHSKLLHLTIHSIKEELVTPP